MSPDERREALEEIAQEVRGCTRCPLHRNRTRAVPGEGHPDTEVIFVGEGPGFNEDQQGRPFVGAAGGLLTQLIESVGWRREEVFITNVVKCRPPGNRDPEPDEIAACAPYLRRQLEVLDPALVVTLGRFSLQTFMPGARIGAAHGTVRPVDPATGTRDAHAYALYHPASAFRQASLRETLQLDMAGVPDALLRARAERADRAQRAERADLVQPGPTVAAPAAGAQAERTQPEAVAPAASTAVASDGSELASVAPVAVVAAEIRAPSASVGGSADGHPAAALDPELPGVSQPELSLDQLSLFR